MTMMPPRENASVRPSSFLTCLIIRLRPQPTRAPAPIEKKSSRAISKSCAPSDTDSTPTSEAATLEATAKRTRATASSIATMPSTIVVSGPFARFSARTSVVAAGAVADDIAPSSKASASDVRQSPVTAKDTAHTSAVTITNGMTASNERMYAKCRPYFFITGILSSEPMRKPMSESAKPLIGSSVSITCPLIRREPDCPIRMPMMMYPTTCGILRRRKT